MNKFIAFLVVVLLLIVAAVKVPMQHEIVITTTKTLFGVVDVGAGATYRVTFEGTLVKYIDNKPIAWQLLDGVECTPATIKEAFEAVGFEDVRVRKMM